MTELSARWVNAVLATDDFPSDVVDRITIKEFGRDRLKERHRNVPIYTVEDNVGPKIAEPTKHGEMWTKLRTGLFARERRGYWTLIVKLHAMIETCLNGAIVKELDRAT
jgi:hypothetical protein